MAGPANRPNALSRVPAPVPARPLALASSTPVEVPPELGPLTKRVHGMAALWPVLNPIAEKLFGPFNPRCVPDWVLKSMSTDWSIGFCRSIWESAYQAVEYRFDGGSPEFRAFLEKTVLPRLPAWIDVALMSMSYGRQTAEIVWGQEDVAYQYAKGGYGAGDKGGKPKIVTGTKPGAYVVSDLRNLDPERVEILADERGDYAGIRYGEVALGGRRTLHIVNDGDQEFGSLLGRAQSLSSYMPWWWGNLVYLGLNRYLERKGDPPLIGFAPGEEAPDEEGNVHDPVRVTAVGLANLKSGGAYVFPQEFDAESKQPLYAVRTLEVAQRAPEFLDTIDRYERLKRLGWLVPYSFGDKGSFASEKIVQQIVHGLYDRRLRRLVLEPLNKHLIPKLVAYNFGAVSASDIPTLAAGSMAENARELFAEILRGAIGLDCVLPDGRTAKIAQLVDFTKGLRALGMATVEPRLIPDAPEPAPEVGAPGARGAAGRPAEIPPEKDRQAAPGRPGAGLSRPVALASDNPEAWLSGVLDSLAEVDRVVWQTEALMESERLSVEAEIKNICRKAIADAKTVDGRLSADNTRLRDEVRRDVEKVLEESLFEDMLDESDLTMDAVALAKGRKLSPLARRHVAASRAGVGVATAAGVKSPPGWVRLRVLKRNVGDAQSNGSGIVVREGRRVGEDMGRLALSEAPIPDVMAKIEAYELPTREWVESTVHHVRASARATIAEAGLAAGQDSWLVTAGPGTQAEVLNRFPSGEVAEALWTVKTTAELDAIATAKAAGEGRAVSSWRNLGLNFFSEEMYVPVAAAALALIEERRRAWNEERARRQGEIETARAAPKVMSRRPARARYV